MSNAKRVHIVAEGEWPLGNDDYHGHEEDCTLLKTRVGGLVLNPVVGLRVGVEHRVREVDPNRYGGVTPIDRLTISGEEAVSWGYLENLVTTMNRAGLNILKAIAQDIEDWPSKPFDIRTDLMGKSIHEVVFEK